MYEAIDKELDDGVDELEDAESTILEENPFYSIKFIEYLVVNVLSLGCLFDHSLMTLNSYGIDVDTNATSEAWNRKYKTRRFSLFKGIFV